jgi:MoaA/NifB/PqqE/SkfB family radical SAM enzyme
MMFYSENQPTTLHIEISSKCNASCPMCARNNQGFGVSSKFKPNNLSLVEIKKNINIEFIRNLKRLMVCGNFGDPLLNPEIVEIFEYFKSINSNLRIELHTNGGVGSQETWLKLAELVAFCRFGIDGLSDTNHIYRKGVSWNNLMNNVKTFISAGGHAQWAFLVFKHNEHQLLEVEEKANEMGFKKFMPKRSTRHINAEGNFVDKWPVYKSNSEIEYYIEQATDQKFQDNLTRFKNLQTSYVKYQDYLNTTEINCKVKDEKSVYLSVDGVVLPCCWLAIDYVMKESTADGAVKGLIEKIKCNESDLNIKTQDIAKIISGSIFSEIENSWKQTMRLRNCARICGSGFDPFKSQF